jgi:hypothetical protein
MSELALESVEEAIDTSAIANIASAAMLVDIGISQWAARKKDIITTR